MAAGLFFLVQDERITLMHTGIGDRVVPVALVVSVQVS